MQVSRIIASMAALALSGLAGCNTLTPPPPNAVAAPSNRTAAIIQREISDMISETRTFLDQTRYPAALARLGQCQALASG